MDSGAAGVGDEDEGDEAKRMGETYASMVLALYVGSGRHRTRMVGWRLVDIE